MMVKELKKKNNMSFISAATGNTGGNSKIMDFLKQKGLAKKAAEGGDGNAVIDGGGGDGGGTAAHSHEADGTVSSGGGGAEQAAVPAPKPKKKNVWGGIGKALTGGLSGLFYKMPAAGKYNNSPIEKNYGTPKQRGFNTPNKKLKSFGVGDSNKEKMAGVGSDLLDK